MKKIFIYSAGPCWKRSLDATKIQNYLTKNNYKIVDKPEDADTIIIITCAFLNYKSEFALNKVKEFQKYGAELIVAGCLPDIDEEELAKIFNGRTLTTKELDNKIELLFPPLSNIKFIEIADPNTLFEGLEGSRVLRITEKIFEKLNPLEKAYAKIGNHILSHLLGEQSLGYQLSKDQFHIRISWGCKGNCSYCAIKKAIPFFKSKQFDECIREFKRGLKEGYKYFILDASDVGAYGLDKNSNFPDLLDEMTKISGDYKISIRELHPRWIVKYIDYLEEIVKRHKMLILDIALQSANSRILKLMYRYSDKDKIRDAVLRLRKATPDVLLTVECIIGFPTETWEEFEETLHFIRDVGFNGGQIYLFSCKNGTEAENIAPKIANEEMIKRLQYSKKFLKTIGYHTYYLSKNQILMFTLRE